MNAPRKRRTSRAAMLSVAGLVTACQVAGPLPDEPTDLVELGRQIFFNELGIHFALVMSICWDGEPGIPSRRRGRLPAHPD